MKRKGFTLVELLVVIAIIALLMGILMPALARVRQLAFRMTCGTNLSGIGKAMLLYANDNEDEMPKAGGRTNTWAAGGLGAGWIAPTRQMAFGLSGNQGNATVTSNFYLLVKYAEVTPKQFVCKGESDTREFTFADLGTNAGTSGFTLSDAWDFGPGGNANPTYEYCSYSYHHPFANYALTTTHEPTMAIAADRNPWMTSPDERGSELSFVAFIPDEDGVSSSTSESARIGNTDAHQLEGQNVLFLDSHVGMEKRSYCGTEQDNIYTVAVNNAVQNTLPYYTGVVFNGLTQKPVTRKDSYLVNEGSAIAGSSSSGGGGGGGR
ncbi:MAG: prepilin-type N-terminal cleavage/methylation domain-containing protein [Planctomycetes bacterium]|nr:prepilin-type N-terminal cleavage/methylation domain-containing protein [Planctomycetota bacterium]